MARATPQTTDENSTTAAAEPMTAAQPATTKKRVGRPPRDEKARSTRNTQARGSVRNTQARTTQARSSTQQSSTGGNGSGQFNMISEKEGGAILRFAGITVRMPRGYEIDWGTQKG